jgi:hypothetical protein
MVALMRNRLLLSCIAAAPLIAQSFYPFAIDQDALSGAPDLSALNHPLTAADRVFVRDGHFFTVGPDGKANTADDRRIRFFGMNFAFGANFPEEKDAVRIARRLRRLGVNLVRLHHMDSSPDRNPEDARSALTQGPYPTLNPVSVPRLRRFLDALAAEGVYANLNLHVGYVFRPGVDGVPPVPGIEMPQHSKPLHIYYPRMIDLQTQYTRKLMDALKLKNDPVLAMVEIDNETSLLHGWMRGLLDRYALGEYKAELQKQWREFFKTDCDLVASSDTANPHLNAWLSFLVDRDHAYLDRMKRAVRDSSDSLVPITGTQMDYGGLLTMDAQAAMDYQDNHFYIDHYNFPHTAWDSRDWRIRDSSSVGSGLATFLNMAAARVAGVPYTVSEFNQPWPNRQAAEDDPTLAAFGAFQDWDGLIHFAYAHGRDWDTEAPGAFNMNGDWGKYVSAAQAAWLFRSGAIQAGKSPVVVTVDRDLQLRFGREKRPGAIANFFTATSTSDPALAFLHPIALKKGAKPSTASVKPTAPYTSDTGELVYDPQAKVYTIQSAKAAGVFGFIGTKKTTAGAIDVALAPSTRGFASILLTPLDGQPIASSARMLLTTPGYTLGESQKFVNYPGTTDWWTIAPEPPMSDRPTGRNSGAAPMLMERVESTVTLRTSAGSVMVYPLDGAGKRLAPIPVEKMPGGFRIHLQADGQPMAPWYEIAR